MAKNGSDVEAALLAADQALAARPKGHAHRIVLFTDALTHSHITPARLRAALPTSGALLHIGIRGSGRAELMREDEHEWDSVTRPTGGLVSYAGLGDGDAAKLGAPYEEWARTLRLDRVAWEAEGKVELRVPRACTKAKVFEELALDDAAIRRVTLRGQLWAEPVQRTLEVSPEDSRQWAAGLRIAASGRSQRGQDVPPGDVQRSGVAPRPRASSTTDRASAWGGAPEPLCFAGEPPWVGPGPFDRHVWLDARLSQVWRDCGGFGSASVGLETTLNEIVLVDEARGLGHPGAIADRCLELAMWDLELPEAFDEPNEGWHLFVDA